MKYYALYKGDTYLYDGTLWELFVKTGYEEDYIKNVMTCHDRIESAINDGTYNNLLIAVEIN